MKRIIFHVDVNNAYLSWTAVKKLQEGEKLDIRTIPSVIAGDETKRHGIILAKSPVAKKLGIVTAETIYQARKKCPNLKVFRADFKWYMTESNKMYNYLKQYTPNIERFSIDECFLDLTGTNLLYKDYLSLAHKIKNDIKEKFGFTVNVGVGNNKLCAKMASDFEKPDKVHTLYKEEIENKMWPLPVAKLFMVGKITANKLNSLGIKTIKDLAKADDMLLIKNFKNQGRFIKESALGIDDSKVSPRNSKNESISISETLHHDIDDKEKLKEILFSQTEELTRNLRNKKYYVTTIAVTYKNNKFETYSHQKKLEQPLNNTMDIYKEVIEVFEDSYKKDLIRNIGMRLSDLIKDKNNQISIFDKIETKEKKDDTMNETIDSINKKFGSASIIPASIKIIGKREKHEKPKE